MPTERPIIPKGMPNPIGRAVFEGTKNPRRIGGELPVYKYPLVSKAPKQFSQKAKLVSTNQWQQLHDILVTTTETERRETEKSEAERRQRLREASDELQRGWCDNEHDKVRRLADLILEEKRAKEAKEKHINEEIETKKKEEQNAKIAAVKDFLKKRGDERYGELQKGLILSETFAQMEENDLIKKEFEKRMEERERIEEIERLKYRQQLDEKADKEKEKVADFYKDVEKFQKYQMDMKKLYAEREKEIAKSYRLQAEGLASDAQRKAAVDKCSKKEAMKSWHHEYQVMAKDREKTQLEYEIKKDLEELEAGRAQENAYNTRKQEEMNERRRRTLANATKQQRAAQWIRDNIIANQVDRTDERISRKKEEEEKAYLENEELEKSRRKKLMDGLMEFKIEDDKIKKSRQLTKVEDKEKAKEKEALQFNEFLDHVMTQDDTRREKAQVHKNFWDNQCNEMKAQRKERRDRNKQHQDDTKTKIAIEDDQLEDYAERLVATQFNKGYKVHPIIKAKEKLGLEARGCPVLIASDSSKIRIQPQPKDIFYRPEDSRERLSINWN